MSRIGKLPITIPKDIKVSCEDSVLIFSKKNEIRKLDVCNRVDFLIENDQLLFYQKPKIENSKAFWGTYRSLAANIIEGFSRGFVKTLEVNGVGYRAGMKGQVLVLQLGFSHPIHFDVPQGISIEIEKETKIIIKGSDNQLVGQVAAEIRSFRPPEPYKGKGVKYSGERIIRKAGKTAKK